MRRRRVEQDGRDKQRQRQLRQNKRRRAGNEREERSTDRKAGYGAPTPRDRRQQRGGENQADENLELVHGQRATGDSAAGATDDGNAV